MKILIGVLLRHPLPPPSPNNRNQSRERYLLAGIALAAVEELSSLALSDGWVGGGGGGGIGCVLCLARSRKRRYLHVFTAFLLLFGLVFEDEEQFQECKKRHACEVHARALKKKSKGPLSFYR